MCWPKHYRMVQWIPRGKSLWHAGGNCKVTSDASPSFGTSLVLFHVRLFKHVVEMVWGGHYKYKFKLLTPAINIKKKKATLEQHGH